MRAPRFPAAEVAIRRAGGLSGVLLRAGIDLGLALAPEDAAALTGRPPPAVLRPLQANGGAAAGRGGWRAREAGQQEDGQAAGDVKNQEEDAGAGAGTDAPPQSSSPAAPAAAAAADASDATRQLGASAQQMPSFDWGPDEEVYFHCRHYEPVVQVGVNGEVHAGL
jgi:hypothetical protein